MAQDNKDKISKLYNTFISEGYDMESEAEFRKNLADPKKRKAAYDALVKDGYEMEAYDLFEQNVGYSHPSKSTQNQEAPEHDVAPTQDNLADFAQTIAGVNQTVAESKQTQERIKNMGEYHKKTGLQLGKSVEGGYRYNPETQDFEQTYLTPTGRRTNNKLAADEESGYYRKETERIRAEEHRKREEEAKDNHNPGFLETVGKSIGSGFLRAGVGFLDVMQQLASGMIVEDASSPTGYTKTRSYEEAIADKNDAITKVVTAGLETADRLSQEAQPHYGRKGFLDMLWDGEIGGFLQKGVATAGESLPMTLSAFNPYTMALNAISMAGSNYREQTLENPDTPAWKRALYSIGSAAIEQAIEKYSDPIFKNIGGLKIFKKEAKEGAEEVTKKVTQAATKNLANRIYHGLAELGKDALGEGVEEVATNFGNDVLGEALDLLNGEKDYGLRAQ